MKHFVLYMGFQLLAPGVYLRAQQLPILQESICSTELKIDLITFP